MCMTYGERRLISIWWQKECLESKMDGQTDSHSDYSAYLRVLHNFDTKSLNIVFIDYLCYANFEFIHILWFRQISVL